MSFFSWSQSNKSRKREVMGITSRAPQSNFQWLMDFVERNCSDLFQVKHFPITNTNKLQWEQQVRECSAVTLYHTKHQGRLNITDVEGALYDEELTFLNRTLGRGKVLVLLDDMDDISEEKKKSILMTQPALERLSSHLILIPENNKSQAAANKLREFQALISEGVRTSQRGEESSSGSRFLSSFTAKLPSITSKANTQSKPRSQSDPTFRIGIFSRAAESNYTWLAESLKADGPMRSVDIKAVYISNNYNAFSSELKKYQFAILYHTKKQGRLNITDVTDSLYDRELREMSEFLGKENVIVVVDDLQNSESKDKERILECQPSICEFARGLFLFTENEKHTKTLESIKDIIRTSLRYHTWDDVPDTVPQTTSHKSRESSMKNYGSSVDGQHRRISKDQSPTQDSSPSSSGSVGCLTASHVSDVAEPQSKKSKPLSSHQKTNPMEVKNALSQATFPDMVDGITARYYDLEEEYQKLKKEKLSQEEVFKSTKESLITEMDAMQKEMEEMKKIIYNKEERSREKEKNLEEREKTIVERERKVDERGKEIEKLEKMVLEKERKINGREKELEKAILERERKVDRHEAEIKEREKIVQQRESKVKEEEIKMNTSFQEREERSHDRETQPQDQERFTEKGGHFKENLQAEKSLSCLENEKSSDLISQLRETIAEKDRKIQNQSDELSNFQLLLDECKCLKK
ncbi:uncharacterized protein ACMZJ9_009861 [Mantella aurantiaca]